MALNSEAPGVKKVSHYWVSVALIVSTHAVYGCAPMENPASIPTVLAELRSNLLSAKHCEYIAGDLIHDTDAIGTAKNRAQEFGANLVLVFNDELADDYYEEGGKRITHVYYAQVVFVRCPDKVHRRILDSGVVLDTR